MLVYSEGGEETDGLSLGSYEGPGEGWPDGEEDIEGDSDGGREDGDDDTEGGNVVAFDAFDPVGMEDVEYIFLKPFEWFRCLLYSISSNRFPSSSFRAGAVARSVEIDGSRSTFECVSTASSSARPAHTSSRLALLSFRFSSCRAGAAARSFVISNEGLFSPGLSDE